MPADGTSPLFIYIGVVFLVLIFAGWMYTLYKWRQTLVQLDRATFWWHWWVAHAVETGEELDGDRVDAAEAEKTPRVSDQVYYTARRFGNHDSGIEALNKLDLEPAERLESND